MFLRRQRCSVQAESPAPARRTVFELAEAARLECESVREAEREPLRRARLQLLHREVGLAGYLASEQMPATRRARLLALVREDLVEPREGPDSELDHICELLLEARSTVDLDGARGLTRPHLRRAREHIEHALKLIGTLQGSSGPRVSGGTAARTA